MPNAESSRSFRERRILIVALLSVFCLAGLGAAGWRFYQAATVRYHRIWDKIDQIDARFNLVQNEVKAVKTSLDQFKEETSKIENQLSEMEDQITRRPEPAPTASQPPAPEPAAAPISYREIQTLEEIRPEAPTLTVALTRDREGYMAYGRNLLLKVPGLDWVKISEARFRFYLEKPGPPAFNLRIIGRPSGPYLEVDGGVRLKISEETKEKPGPLDGFGDFDGNQGEYYEAGRFHDGLVRLSALPGGGYLGRVDLTVNGADQTGLFRVPAGFDFLLEPIASLQGAELFRPEIPAWKKYRAFLEELAKPRYQKHTFREALELKNPSPDKVYVFLRHDMDLTMYGALAMAAQEHHLGIKGTYFINMASGIYAVMAPGGRYRANPAAIENLLFIQDLGHEVGYHTDVLMQTLFYDVPLRGWLFSELGRLRRFGLDIVTEAENGSPLCDRSGTMNRYAYNEFRSGGRIFQLYRQEKPSGPMYGFPENGMDGVVRYERDGQPRTYTVTPVARPDVGLRVSAYRLPEFYGFKRFLYKSDLDQDFMDDPVQVLRHTRSGTVLEVMIHPSTYTTLDPEFDLVIDPEFQVYRKNP